MKSDLTEEEWRRLEELADVVVPTDKFYSASETGFRQFLEQNWHDIIPGREPELRKLLSGEPLEQHAWFVQIVGESYYANPENGGNYGGASFFMIGFEDKPEIEIPHE
jgi:hypothetical protein